MIVGLAALFFINVAGKPLIAFVFIGFMGLFCVCFILCEIYDFFAGETGAWLDIDP